MPNQRKRLTAREVRRLQTRRERHGMDFDRRNARKAGRASTTKFTSQTGREAALHRHELERARKREQERDIREAK